MESSQYAIQQAIAYTLFGKERACLVYNLNVPIKAKDPPWFAVQMGSVADSVLQKIRIIIDNTNYWASKIMPKWISLTYLYLTMLNLGLKSYFTLKSATKPFNLLLACTCPTCY